MNTRPTCPGCGLIQPDQKPNNPMVPCANERCRVVMFTRSHREKRLIMITDLDT